MVRLLCQPQFSCVEATPEFGYSPRFFATCLFLYGSVEWEGRGGILKGFFLLVFLITLFVLGFALVAGSNHARNCMRIASTMFMFTNKCIVGGMDQLEQPA